MKLNEEYKKLKDTVDKVLIIVTELKMGLLGSEKLDFEGVIQKVKRHEKYIQRDKRLKYMIYGGIMVISFLVTLLIKLWDKIF